MTEDALMRKGTVVLQSSQMSPGVVPGSCSDTSVTSTKSAHEVFSRTAEEDKEIDIKEEEFPVPVSFPTIFAASCVLFYYVYCCLTYFNCQIAG
jgi:hypothetical protein